LTLFGHQQEAALAPSSYRSTSSLHVVQARAGMDPSLRLQTYGRIRSLDQERHWWERLFRR
jgi:hypothetical protein